MTRHRGKIQAYDLAPLVVELRSKKATYQEIVNACNEDLKRRGINDSVTYLTVQHFIKTKMDIVTTAQATNIENGIQRMVTDIHTRTKDLIIRCERILDSQEKQANVLNTRDIQNIVSMMEQLRAGLQQMTDTVKLIQPQIQVFNQRVVTIAETIATDSSLPVDARRRLLDTITERIVPTIEGEKA